MSYKMRLSTAALHTLGSVVDDRKCAAELFVYLVTSQSNIVTVMTRLAGPVTKQRSYCMTAAKSGTVPARRRNSKRRHHSTEQHSTTRDSTAQHSTAQHRTIRKTQRGTYNIHYDILSIQ